MPLEIIRQDITQMHVDAIVNAANEQLARGGGVCGAIHAAAGPELEAACRRIGFCKTGRAVLTPGYALPAKYVIHTPGPVWRGGLFGEKALLASCYRESLSLAVQHGCKSIAFPLISSGIYGFPKASAFRIAGDSIRAFLLSEDCDPDLMVYLLVFDKESLGVSKKLCADIAQYIDDHYAYAHRDNRQRRLQLESMPAPMMQPCAAPMPDEDAAPASLEEVLDMMDESFSEMLLRKIDEKGFKKDSECYKRANLDRKLFSKIRSDLHYKPKKTTVLAFAIALKLSPEETRELLLKAGFSLSHSQKLDLIVEYFIVHGIYDIQTINAALYRFDQPLLGGRSE